MECAAKVSEDISNFMRDTGLNEAFLFGGAVLDPLTRENAKISDYDLCVKNQDDFYEALRNLEGQNIEISEVMRTHNVYVVIKHPQYGQIDFSCMDPEDNGIFDVEKIYARFVRRKGDIISNEVIDKYGAIDGIKRGEIRIASNPEKEGAYNILRRFLAVSGKYNLDISRNGPNQQTINQMNEAFKNSVRYIPQDRVRCLSRLVASLRRSSDRGAYVRNLAEQKVFENAFPEIHKLFMQPEFQNDPRLVACETQKDLLKMMMLKVGDGRDALLDCFSILSRREKARQDKGVRSFVEELQQEKTSPTRLNKEILTPLFRFIAAKNKEESK